MGRGVPEQDRRFVVHWSIQRRAVRGCVLVLFPGTSSYLIPLPFGIGSEKRMSTENMQQAVLGANVLHPMEVQTKKKIEVKKFAQRLRRIMRDSGYRISPTVLAHEFNLRYFGGRHHRVSSKQLAQWHIHPKDGQVDDSGKTIPSVAAGLGVR
jgi:hypothetical protein